MSDRYAVFGNPVAHSRSPAIHTAFAAETGQDIIYERILAPSGDREAPMKTCPQCASMVLAGSAVCQDCQYEFKKPCPWCGEPNAWDAQICAKCDKPMKKTARHETEAADGDPINGEDVEPVWYDVTSAQYWVHEKRGAPEGHPKTLRVDYLDGYNRVAPDTGHTTVVSREGAS
jgi:hypothetical protein